ncbi:hypothetical protein KAURM247S_06172 [Kitasatospora aureofaciens]
MGPSSRPGSASAAGARLQRFTSTRAETAAARASIVPGLRAPAGGFARCVRAGIEQFRTAEGGEFRPSAAEPSLGRGHGSRDLCRVRNKHANPARAGLIPQPRRYGAGRFPDCEIVGHCAKRVNAGQKACHRFHRSGLLFCIQPAGRPSLPGNVQPAPAVLQAAVVSGSMGTPWRIWIHLPAPPQRCRHMRRLTYARRRHASNPKVPKDTGCGDRMVCRPLFLVPSNDDVSAVELGASVGVVLTHGGGRKSARARAVDDGTHDPSPPRPGFRAGLQQDALGRPRPWTAQAAPRADRPRAALRPQGQAS